MFEDDEGWWWDDYGAIGTEDGGGTIEDDPGATVQGTNEPNDGYDQDYYDNGDGTWTGADGIVYDDDLNVLGVDLGDGRFATLDGEILDADGNSLGWLNSDSADESSGFWSGLDNFLSKLFGGGSGGSGGGGFGGGATGGQASMAQKAQQLGQQLAQARASGASADTIAALQRQLAVAQLALSRGGGINTQTILIASVVGLGVYALLSSRRNS